MHASSENKTAAVFNQTKNIKKRLRLPNLVLTLGKFKPSYAYALDYEEKA
jgi:hypothetical protein